MAFSSLLIKFQDVCQIEIDRGTVISSPYLLSFHVTLNSACRFIHLNTQSNSVITSLCLYKRVSFWARCIVKLKETCFKTKYSPACTLLIINAKLYFKFNLQLKFINNTIYSYIIVLFRTGLAEKYINLLKPTRHVMHQRFNIQQLYVLPTLYLYVLYLSENKQRLVPLTA